MKSNRIKALFDEKGKEILSVYFCAGFPKAENTAEVISGLERNGVDMVEVGIPFSDPIADGKVIQDAATKALRNGMSLKRIFVQLAGIRRTVRIPLVLMGYMNPIMQYGFEEFFKSCSECGIDGCIIPDLPFEDYMTDIKPLADKYSVSVIMLVTPETSDDRIRKIDDNTDGFIYMVSTASTTGAKERFDDETIRYFERINSMNLRNPRMIGFGISNRATFAAACANAAGGIIGSRFISIMGECGDAETGIRQLKEELSR